MKKFISMLLVLTMLFALAACGSKQETKPEPEQPAQEEVTQPEETPVETPAQPEEAPEETPAETPAPSGDQTMGQILGETFQAEVDGAANLEDLANTILSNEVIQFSGLTMPVEPGYLNGFSEEIHGFSEGVIFAPMIGSIPFVGYVFQVEDGASVEDFMQSLEDAANLRWNVCTEADEMVLLSSGNTVFFVMCPSSVEG